MFAKNRVPGGAWKVRPNPADPIQTWPSFPFPEDPKAMRKGIWKIDGDILLVCFGAMSAERPTDFTAPKDSKRNLWTLKRK